jgi:hypothetical protein
MDMEQDPFSRWLDGFDAAANYLLETGVERDVVLGLNVVLRTVNLARLQALVATRRAALDAALADAPLVEAA